MTWLIDEKSLEEKVLNELSVEKAFKHVIWLYENTGEEGRLAGTPNERKACEYIKKTLESYGLDVDVLEFESYIQYARSAQVEVVSPEKRIINGIPALHISPTPPEGVEGELVYVGGGSAEDYKKIDVKGKFVLTRMNLGPNPINKSSIANKNGAKGIIIASWSPPEERVITRGLNGKWTWGAPTPEMMKMEPYLLGVDITRADGDYLENLCKKHTVRIRVKADVTPCKWTKHVMPTVTVEADIEKEKYVLIGGHYDTWPGGCCCNGNGNAIMLELARVMAKYRKHLRRSVKFIWWSGHEIVSGVGAGSTWYLDTFWDDLNKNCVAYRCIDTQGIQGPYMFCLTTEEVRKFSEDVVKDVLKEIPYAERYFKIGDMSFLGIGIPMFYERTSYAEEKRKPGIKKVGSETTKRDIETKAAAIGEGPASTWAWWIHDPADTPDRTNKDAMAKELKTYAVSILRLCNSPVLPFEFASMSDEFINRLNELQSKGGHVFDLTNVIDKAKELKKEAMRLKKKCDETLSEYEKKRSEENLKKVNSVLMKLSRVLQPVLYTIAGKYGQDDYGLMPPLIPAMEPITELATLDPNSSEFKALRVKLTRERNKVSDALEYATAIIRDYIL